MNIDGHFPRWGVAEEDIERTAQAVLDLFIDGIAKPSRQSRDRRRSERDPIAEE
jgi:hypothetical protein